MKTRIISAIFIVAMVLMSAEAQIQRRPGTGASTAQSLQNTASNVNGSNTNVTNVEPRDDSGSMAYKKTDSYVIAVEGEYVYTDVPDENIVKGSSLYICEPAGYFIHPITKAKIAREMQVVCELVVEDILPTYLQAVVVPESVKVKLKPGLPLYMGEGKPRTADIAPVEPVVNPELEKKNKYEEALMLMIETERELYPTVENDLYRILPCEIKGKTVVIVYEYANKVFNTIMKSYQKGKFPERQNLDSLRKSTFHKIAERAGYNTVMHFQNKDNTKSFDVPIVTVGAKY